MKNLFFLLFFTIISFTSFSQNEFITTWDTRITTPSVISGTTAIRFPGSGSNYQIYWEDVTNSAINGIRTGNGETLISFPSPGVYRIKVTPGSGSFTGFGYGNGPGDAAKLLTVEQWGTNHWTSGIHFRSSVNMDVTATDIPDLSGLNSLTSMFQNCYNLKGNTSFSNWNVSSIQDFTLMFAQCYLFNQPIGGWNVAAAYSIANMFQGARLFDQPLNNWNTSNVITMQGVFLGASSFNQPLENWNTSKVTNMWSTFLNATSFNQPLNTWDVSNVTRMQHMFEGAKVFNQPLDKWNTAKVQDMCFMFAQASSFDQSLATFNLTSIVNNTSFDWDGLYFMLNFDGMSCENYSKTLMGWAGNTTTPSNIDLSQAGGRVYGPAAVYARNYLISTLGWTIAGDTYDPSCSFTVLPVIFGNIQAFIKEREFRVNWLTLTEKNNDSFIIEVSKNGKDFIRISEVASKALEGNSDNIIRYEFATDVDDVAALFGISVFAVLAFGGLTRRKNIIGALLLAGIFLFGFSCNKQADLVDTGKDSKIFVRIVQVDKDGTTEYSKVVQAIYE